VPIKVSVVVPVYNPGKHFAPLIESLKHQSMPRDDFEVVFVDDGSTDGTAAQLDRLVAENDNYRVIHTPSSGGPGRPRNVGIEAAVGEYVQFVDNDDWLGTEALERLYAYAVANNADVVVGKEVREGARWSLWPLFDHNRPNASLHDDPLLGLLTPHKMFRRSFLNAHALRFPEGPRRLEDHPFVVRAYFLADVISVLSDYPCYYWLKRADRTNAGTRPREWRSWYADMADVLEVVHTHTEPGPYRDRLLAHWLRSKGVRLLGAGLVKRTPAEARELFDALADLTARWFPPSVDAYLPQLSRIKAALLRAGDFDRIWQLAELAAGLRLHQQVQPVQVEGGALLIDVTAHMCYADGSPVLLDVVDGRARWRCPIDLGTAVDPQDLDFTRLTERIQLDVVASSEATNDVVRLPGMVTRADLPASGQMLLQATTRIRIGPKLEQGVARRNGFAAGEYDLHLKLAAGGWTTRARLTSPVDLADGVRVREAVHTPRSNLALLTRAGHLTLQVRPRQSKRRRQTGVRVDPLASYAFRRDGALHVVLRLPRLDASAKPAAIRLTPRDSRAGENRSVKARAAVDRTDHGLVVNADVQADQLTPGTWQLGVRLDDGSVRKVRARILLGAQQPVALLPDL
jgi:glycosyltransferase involved in cell wall biosynthesis